MLRILSLLSGLRNLNFMHHVNFVQIMSSGSQEIVSSYKDWSLNRHFLVLRVQSEKIRHSTLRPRTKLPIFVVFLDSGLDNGGLPL